MIRNVFSVTLILLTLGAMRATAEAALAPTPTNTLTIEQAIQLALTNNFSLQATHNETEISRNNQIVGGAGFLPKVDLTGAYVQSINKTDQIRVNALEEKNPHAKTTSQNAGVNATWTVFDGLGSFSAYRHLTQNQLLAELKELMAQETLVAQVTTTYFAAIKEDKILQTIQSAIAFSQERVKITDSKYHLGSNSKLDLLQAQLDLNLDKNALLRQGIIYRNAKRSLNLVLGRDSEIAFTLPDSISFHTDINTTLLKKAWEQNSMLRYAQENKKLAQISFAEAKALWFPKVALNVGYNYVNTNSDFGLIRTNESEGLIYGANLTFNLFNGFTMNRDYKNARLFISSTELQIRGMESQVQNDLAKAADAYSSSLELLTLEKENVGLSKQNLDVSMEKLRLGAITSLEVRAIEEAYITANSRLVSAQYETKKAETDLLRLAGILRK